jgi:hypothetical protein
MWTGYHTVVVGPSNGLRIEAPKVFRSKYGGRLPEAALGVFDRVAAARSVAIGRHVILLPSPKPPIQDYGLSLGLSPGANVEYQWTGIMNFGTGSGI